MFAIGFAMGAVRLLFLTPLFDELLAVVIELPIMLGLSWVVCGRAILRWSVVAQTSIRGAMSVAAFVTLMLLDGALGLLLFVDSPAELVGRWLTPAGAIGFAGQIAFALFPLLHRKQ